MDKETSEIAKLTERISKDIKSKLFVPLAEEYKKAGDLDMAIHVLSEGLKNNPSYVTARSVLGKLLLEKGELSRAQKEFEEVVKAIPDNILAQRKLGDICALQNRPDEALKQYKAVLSLNPRDEEVASLVADIAEGRDVRPRLQQPKPQHVPEKSVKQEVHAASPSPAQPQTPTMPLSNPPEVSGATLQTGEQKKKIEIVPETISASAPLPASYDGEEEEAEEVLVVEPLEAVIPGPESTAPGFDFSAEKDRGEIQAPYEEEHAETPFPASERPDEELTGPDYPRAEAGSVPGAGSENTPSSADEIPVETDFVDAEIGEEVPQAVIAETSGEAPAAFPEVVAAEAPAGVSEKSDDFTTDTLAELYIAQGFHEKAIDIYQRMLADKPSSKGLKDKLERVRAMAALARADQIAPEEEAALKAETFAEPKEYHPAQEAIEEKRGDDLFAESREYRPAPEKDEGRGTGSKQGVNTAASPFAREDAREKPVYAEFEAREYIPPTAEFAIEDPETEKTYAAAKPSQANRRVTVDRLETWLHNIKKEK
jgi:tetratricopeptide (TPR) repeat protein